MRCWTSRRVGVEVIGVEVVGSLEERERERKRKRLLKPIRKEGLKRFSGEVGESSSYCCGWGGGLG